VSLLRKQQNDNNSKATIKVIKISYCKSPWNMPAILATQEAEIRRIAVQSQPGHIVQETLS
jgi:hypothetical protein